MENSSEILFQIMNVIIILGILGKLVIMFNIIFSEPNKVEKIIRISTFTVAILIFLISKVYKLSITDILVSALTTGSVIKFGLFGFLIPIIVGWFLTEYIISTLKENEFKAIRILILIATLSILQYADVYYAAKEVAKTISPVDAPKVLTTNMMFTISLILSVIFRYDNTTTS